MLSLSQQVVSDLQKLYFSRVHSVPDADGVRWHASRAGQSRWFLTLVSDAYLLMRY